MAMKLAHSDDALPENSEINVTPFIDVMLVLLIIFMIAAPLSTVERAVELPVSTAEPKPQDQEPVFLSLREDLSTWVGDNPIPRDGLGPALDARTKGDKAARIFLRADKGVPYGDLMELMNALRDTGYLKVSLVGLESGEAAGAQ